ncbi:hypothetical protein PG999_007811 [Apiospora kogelbergensis]|uniref:Uncharacterized protein n=1 Tax=Apiospora kogelbergensis TaxID=1337665 RepID=A0AAW0QSZ1_9PEZI
MATAPYNVGDEKDHESASSSDAETISSPRSKQRYRFETSAGGRYNTINARNGNVVVHNHQARCYDRDEPHPTYSQVRSLKRLGAIASTSRLDRVEYFDQLGTGRKRNRKAVLREIDSAGGVRITQTVIQPDESVREIDEPRGRSHTAPVSLLATEWWRYPLSARQGSVTSRASSVFDTSHSHRTGSSAPSETSDGFYESSVDTYQSPFSSKSTQCFLPCEFSYIANCRERFAVDEFDAWLEHISDLHLHEIYPDHCLCWFCDDVEFVAKSHGINERTNFRNRMKHIRDHFTRDGLGFQRGRPDWGFLDHLSRHDLIDRKIYDSLQTQREGPKVDGEVSYDFRTPEQRRNEELSQRVPYDMREENREIKRREVQQTPHENRLSSGMRSPPGEDSNQGTIRHDTIIESTTPAQKSPYTAKVAIEPSGDYNEIQSGSAANVDRSTNKLGHWLSDLIGQLHHYLGPLFRQVSHGLSGDASEVDAAVVYAQSASSDSSAISVASSGTFGRRREDSRSSSLTQPTLSTDISDDGNINNPPPGEESALSSPPPPGTEYQTVPTALHNAILYHRIRTEYHKLRSQMARNIFVVPTRVEYVKFELMQRRQTGECVGNHQTDSIPSIKEVMNRQYAFWPCPPAVGSIPIQSHIFMHSFLTPGDHGSTRDFERLPKKLNTKLSCSLEGINARQVPVGWGIYIVEDLNTTLLASLLLAVLLVVLIITIAWSIQNDDIHGGMGIGQFAIAFITGVLVTSALRNKASLGAF